MQDLLADFANWIGGSLAIFADPPYSAILIVFASVSLSTISNLGMKKFADMRRLKRYQTEIKQYREMQKEAERTQNAKLLKKVKRRKAYIDRIQREMMTERCKPSLLFMIPFLLLFTFLRNFYTDPNTGLDKVVAVIPFNIHKVLPFLTGFVGTPVAAGFGLTFWGFYFLVGLGLSGILQRMMGTQLM